MAVDLTMANKLVATELAPNSTYSATPGDPRFFAQQIADAVQAADRTIAELIAINPKHPRRSAYRQTTTLAHAAALPAHIGPIGSVIIGGKAATVWPKEDIERERTNPLALTLLDAHYDVEGETIFHTGATAATVEYFALPSDPGAGTGMSPDSYLHAVVCGALAILFPVEGENTGTASHYASLWARYLELIRLAVDDIPPMEQMAA